VTIQQFIKLNFEEKSESICENGNLIDTYNDGLIDVKVFSIDDFFVEVISSSEEEKIIEIIPYQRGFSFFFKQKELQKKRADSINYFFLL
jgi:hypothetical protein